MNMSVLSSRAKIVTVANLKGGSGKTTIAINAAMGLTRAGYRVLCIDSDAPQYSLFRYVNNRSDIFTQLECFQVKDMKSLQAYLDSKSTFYDVIIIDTGGNLTDFTKQIHTLADMLITPLNDSLLDLDLIADVTSKTMKLGPYGEYIWEVRKQKALCNKKLEWLVIRNRLSHLFNKNKEHMFDRLHKLSKFLGFKLLDGVTERVVYKQCFEKGMTVFDLESDKLIASQIAARQEVRALVLEMIDALDLNHEH